MATVKTVLVFMLVCALLGVVVSTFFATQFVVWYNQPGGGNAAMCNCLESASTSVRNFLHWQLGGLASGSVGGLVVGILFVRWRKLRATALAKEHPINAAQLPAVSTVAAPAQANAAPPAKPNS